MNTYFIYPVVGHLVDVFKGDGWKEWSRVYCSLDTPKLMMGRHIPIRELYDISAVFFSWKQES